MKFDIVALFDKVYSRLPGLGVESRQFIVRILPIFALVFGILLTLASIFDFIGSPFITSFSLGGGSQIVRELLIRSTLGIIQGVLMVFAYPRLKRVEASGWRLLFWSQILWIVSGILGFSIWFVLGLLIFYPLFQVRRLYINNPVAN